MTKLDKLFSEIKLFVFQGNDINSFSPNEAVLYKFLDYYYTDIIYGSYEEDGDPYDDGDNYSDELLLPLSQRSYEILSKVQWLLSNGADPNAGGDWLPLMLPVAFLDYAMTEFLLENGANAHYSGEEDGDLPYGCGNYFIDDLDVTALNISLGGRNRQIIFERILKIATLFAKHGVTNVHTHCIDIDGESRIVSATQAKVKY